MAMMTNIPPQAYTRDTLVKAIEWISHQSSAVRERANSADLIVSYYLQARRRMTPAQMEAPASGENFKQDLKHMAQELRSVDESSAPPPTGPNRSLSHDDLPEPLPLNTHNHLHSAQQHVHLHVQQAPQVHMAPSQSPLDNHPAASRGVTWAVDARSLAIARELQSRFNLSNEGEAIRMLVTLGIERLRDLFP